MNKKIKVFIDAGHGEDDPGAVGNGMRESDIVLEVATHLNVILRGVGIETKMSRTGDTRPALRHQTANQWGADLLVSIHANAGGGTGVETVIATSSPRNLKRDLAESRKLASMISNALGQEFGMRVRRDNGVMLETETPRRSIGVLRESTMTAVLPEIAFIDSPPQNPDIDVLRNRRADVAFVIARCICQFFNIEQINNTATELDRTVNIKYRGKTIEIKASNTGGRFISNFKELAKLFFDLEIPVRDALQLAGKRVEWDGATNTISVN